MINADGDPIPAGRRDPLGRFLDGLGSGPYSEWLCGSFVR